MSRRDGSLFLLLLALAVVLWGGSYVRRGLWEPDEARYAYVAREMRTDGRWFVPHLHGEPYPDKPPLFFWLVNAGMVFTGDQPDGVTARWPSLLGGLLTLAVTARLARRWGGGEAAGRAVLVLATSWLFWYETSWGRIDALLCGLVLLSVDCLVHARERPVWAGFLPAYLLAGLAMLAKGPVGLVVPLGIFAAVSVAERSAAPTSHRWHWLWGPVLAAAIPGVWLLVAWAQHAPPAYFAAMFGVKSFGRVLQAADHAQPWYYFLLHVPVELLPWTLFLPAAWRGLGPGDVRRRLGAWFVFVVVLFSLFATKRNQYVLAAYPAAALIVALGWDRGFAGFSSAGRRWLAGLAIGLMFLAGLVEAVAPWWPQWPVVRWPLAVAATVLLAGAVVLVTMYRRQGFAGRWFAVFAGAWFVHHVAVGALVLPAFNAIKAPVALAAEARELLPAAQPVYLYRQQLAIVPLYAERPGRTLRSVAELELALARHEYGVVVFLAPDWEALPGELASRLTIRAFTIGSKRLVWAEFGVRPAQASSP